MSKREFLAAKLPKDHSQMRSFWYGRDKCFRPEGREPLFYRTFSAGIEHAHLQTFHVWLWSFGGFAARNASFDTDS